MARYIGCVQLTARGRYGGGVNTSSGSRWGGKETAPVGSFAVNGFGLYDMAGNVFEWTEDCLHLDYNGAPMNGSAWLAANNSGDCTNRIERGATWIASPALLRSTVRNAFSPVTRIGYGGFRGGRTLNTR